MTAEAIARWTRTVSYTGDNNVTYERVCEPNASDVSITAFRSVFAPRIHAWVSLHGEEYVLDWYNAGDEYAVVQDTFHGCRVCAEEGAYGGVGDLTGMRGVWSSWVSDPALTYCDNCGRVACQRHIRTEHTTGDPVCTACAVTARYAGARKYFFSAEERSAFEREYAAMGIGEKVQENPIGVVAVVVVVLWVVLMIVM